MAGLCGCYRNIGTPCQSPISMQCLERTSNALLWSGMTEKALSLQSTRSGGTSSVGEVDLWRIPPTKNTFPQHVWRAVYQADNLYSSTALSGWSKKSTPSNSWNSKNVCARETIRTATVASRTPLFTSL